MVKWLQVLLVPGQGRQLRFANRFGLVWLLTVGGNLLYARSWLEIPDPLLGIWGLQMALGSVYFLGQQVMLIRHNSINQVREDNEK
ncbi:MAG: hypothetical protein Q6K99_01715 [Thermostichales cyanobacterium BF4_bins_65]